MNLKLFLCYAINGLSVHPNKEKIFVFLFPLIFMGQLSAQELPNVILPSPQTRELNKYIDFPVDLSTGVPEISIPLYTIKTKGIEIPITLNYHASGIKHAQDDGDVGVGWSLNCNYRVSRTIYGFADTEDIPMTPSSYQSNLNTLTGLELDKYLSRFISDYPGSVNPDLHMPPRSGGILDGEYDHFNYLIPNQGGKFIISNRYSKTVSEFSPTTNKFNYIEGTAANNLASGIIGFRIKDADQNVFSFGEQVDKLGANVLETNIGPLNKKDVTAWALTDIDTKYEENIKFSYSNRQFFTKDMFQASLSVSLPSAIVPIIGPYSTWEYTMDNDLKSFDYQVFDLESIVATNEQIDFVELNNPYMARKIHAIDVKNTLTNTLIKRVEFYYSEQSVYLSTYVFLDSLKIFDRDLVTFEKYIFDYHDRNIANTTYLLPDQWGYNKIVSSSVKLLHEELGDDYGDHNGSPDYPPYQGTNTVYHNSGFGGYFTDREVNNRPEIFSLKSITYPTGGRTVFDYESNKVKVGSNLSKYSGGIRIKAITKFKDTGNQPSMLRYYTYEKDGISTGVSTYTLNHDDFRNERVRISQIPSSTPGDYFPESYPRRWVNYSSRLLSEVNPITYYAQVTEHLSGMGGTNDNKIIYYFSNTPYSFFNNYSGHIHIANYGPLLYNVHLGPMYISEYREWQKPKLVRKDYFDNTRLLKKDIYVYSQHYLQFFDGLKVRPFARTDIFFNELYHGYSGTLPFYKRGMYTINTGKYLLSQRSETLYTETDSITKNTSYQYNALDQVTMETMVDSKGQVVNKQRVYPYDISYNHDAMRMLQANDVNKVLEEIVTVNSDTVEYLKNDYFELTQGLFVPSKLKKLDKQNNSYEDRIVFHRYDSTGNVMSVSKANDTRINYIWSYMGQFPIAEIKGPNYETIENILGASAILTFRNLSNPTKQDIDNFLVPVRNAIAVGSLGTTELMSYSYDPLLGIKTITDSRGKTIYYEYDGFGRLKLMKDDSGAIEQKTDYHYRNQ